VLWGITHKERTQRNQITASLCALRLIVVLLFWLILSDIFRSGVVMADLMGKVLMMRMEWNGVGMEADHADRVDHENLEEQD
jgi:hypothetical protein